MFDIRTNIAGVTRPEQTTCRRLLGVNPGLRGVNPACKRLLGAHLRGFEHRFLGVEALHIPETDSPVKRARHRLANRQSVSQSGSQSVSRPTLTLESTTR
eukprot:1867575-Pyramimonas_sp.AAC.1